MRMEDLGRLSRADLAAAGPARQGDERKILLWLVLLGLAIPVLLLSQDRHWLADYPAKWTLPLAEWLQAVMGWFSETFRDLFRAVAWGLQLPMTALHASLQWLPWCVVVALVTLLAWQAAGTGTAVFAALAQLYIVVLGYWSQSMSTLALVGISIPLSIALGFLLGTLCHRSGRIRAVVLPLLDLMQAIPAFAYLIPILLLFGFGPVVGLIASAIFATPPMVRNTLLGFARVPAEVRESSLMSGCTRRQSFWWVEVPSAMPQLMIGINQTTMAALSMVIIAAIIGGFDDIGWEVLSTMRKAQFGQSLLSGIVIALLAMLLDRITSGFALRSRLPLEARGRLGRGGLPLVAGSLLLGGFALATLAAPLWVWPEAWTVNPAAPINRAMDHLTTEYTAVMDAIKNGALFYLLLPIKIGLKQAVAPFTWGFVLTPALQLAYFQVLAVLALVLLRLLSWRAAVGLLLLGGLVFYGTTGTPWPVFIAVLSLLAYQVGGTQVAALALGAQLFLLLTGLWERAMLSVYLCGAAVGLSVVLGVSLGILASLSDRVSAFIRPINDTLQTMPQFVLLIPILMVFGVGDFTALLAILLYAVVPSIRYTEQGLRKVSSTQIEAGRAMGCSGAQLFWGVKLPQALPEILLGINQTVMFGLAMLVIAALVGTAGLGQLIYIALSKADAGQGFVAGLGIALIAMVSDRILQAAARSRKAALGLV